MQESLPDGQKMRILICEQQGVPVAGVIGTALGNSGIYLFGATSTKGMQSKGSYLLQWRMIQQLKENGVRYYNLGGINPESNPGVYHFKKGLAGQDVLYLNPLVCSRNALSSALARCGGKMQSGLRNYLTNLHKGAEGSDPTNR